MEWYFTLGGMIFTAIVNIVIVTKYLTNIELKVETIRAQGEKTLTEKFNKSLQILEKELNEKDDTLRHDIGESLKPIKTLTTDYEKKHYQLEIYIRDNYISVDTFKEVINEIKNDIKDIGRKLDAHYTHSATIRKN